MALVPNVGNIQQENISCHLCLCTLHFSGQEPAGKARNTVLIEAIDLTLKRKVVMSHRGQRGTCLVLGYLLALLCPILMVQGQIQEPQSEKSLMTRDLDNQR